MTTLSLFTEEAREWNLSASRKMRIIYFQSKEYTIPSDTTNRKNFFYVSLIKIYHELCIHTFLTNRQRHTNEDYDADTIMKLLVFSRILSPASKKKSYEERSKFFEKGDYSLDDIYRCLTFLNKHKESLQLWLNKKIKDYTAGIPLLFITMSPTTTLKLIIQMI